MLFDIVNSDFGNEGLKNNLLDSVLYKVGTVCSV